MLKDAALIAKECIRHPGRRAVWSPDLGRYVCPDMEEGQKVSVDFASTAHPAISPEFKLVFVTAAVGNHPMPRNAPATREGAPET